MKNYLSNSKQNEYLKLICDPIIGCVPTLEIASENSSAPHKLCESHKPRAFILFSLHIIGKSEVFKAPSHIEY